jgi:hypothetical protein
MQEEALQRFLASVRCDRLIDYLDPIGETAEEALARRIRWARMTRNDPAHADEAMFLLQHESSLKAILQRELSEDSGWVEGVEPGTEYASNSAWSRDGDGSTEFGGLDRTPAPAANREAGPGDAVDDADDDVDEAAESDEAPSGPYQEPEVYNTGIMRIEDITLDDIGKELRRELGRPAEGENLDAAVEDVLGDEATLDSVDDPKVLEEIASLARSEARSEQGLSVRAEFPDASDDSDPDEEDDGEIPVDELPTVPPAPGRQGVPSNPGDKPDPALKSPTGGGHVGLLQPRGRVRTSTPPGRRVAGPTLRDNPSLSIPPATDESEGDMAQLRPTPQLAKAIASAVHTGEVDATDDDAERDAAIAPVGAGTTPTLAPGSGDEREASGPPLWMGLAALVLLFFVGVGGTLIAWQAGLFGGAPGGDVQAANVTRPAPTADPTPAPAADPTPAPAFDAELDPPEPEPAAEPEPVPDVEPAADPEPAAVPEPVPDVEPAAAPEPVPDPEPVADVEPAGDPAPAPAPTEDSEPDGRVTPQPAEPPAPVGDTEPEAAPDPEPSEAPDPAPSTDAGSAGTEDPVEELEPGPPEEEAPELRGTWMGEAGGSGFILRVQVQTGSSFSGRAEVLQSTGSWARYSVTGSLDTQTGAVRFSNLTGDVAFSGTLEEGGPIRGTMTANGEQTAFEVTQQ